MSFYPPTGASRLYSPTKSQENAEGVFPVDEEEVEQTTSPNQYSSSVSQSTVPAPSSNWVTPMLTDMYQLTMVYAYWKNKQQEDRAVFEVFFRKNPFQGEYTIFAGLSEVIRYISNFRFRDDDIKYLKQSIFPPNTPEEFFEYLSNLDCSQVTVHSMAEGTVVFPRTPLIRIEGPLGICQLLESTILNLTNFPSLIATNAARMRLAAGEDKVLLEFGLRRAQGPDGAMTASRYAFMGGFDGTSNIRAAQTFGISARGTHAHAFVSAFDGGEQLVSKSLGECENFWDNVVQIRGEMKTPVANIGELAAFVAFAQAFPHNFNALVDTYDTMKSGIPNFLAVAVALERIGYHAKGIRLDSGDLAFLSIKAREMFADAAVQFQVNLDHLSIVASNDINESVLSALDEQGHSVDCFGIGTNLVTCQAQPALGMVYKLVEINGRPAIKLSNDFNKVTIPGKKHVYRLIGNEGVALCDVMVADHEAPPAVGKKLMCRHPYIAARRAFVTPSYVIELLRPVFIGPEKRVAPEPSLTVIRQHVIDQLTLIRSDHKRALNPAEYKVSVTEALFSFMHELWLDKVAVPELQ